MKPNILLWLLSGERSHADPARCFDGLSADDAGRSSAPGPYTIFQVLNHMRFWQNLYLRRLDGAEAPTPPSAADGWPGAPAPEGLSDLEAAVGDFRRGLAWALGVAASSGLEDPLPHWGGINRAHGLALLAAHNAYHAGQVVLLRKQFGDWPPPGVGDTW